MPIFKGSNKIAGVYNGNASVASAYKGDIKVFNDNSGIPEQYGYISFYIGTSFSENPEIFIIPTTAYSGEGLEYDWNVRVNGDLVGHFTGTSGENIYGGIPVDIDPGYPGTIVTITPGSKITPGWGIAFGFSDIIGSNQANSQDNRNKITEIINDPDYAHLKPDGSVGDYFRAYQYYYCMSLPSSAPEDITDNVTTIGSYFRAYQYSNCTSLTSTSIEVIPDSVTSLGSHFRTFQYSNCASLTTPAGEVIPDTVMLIGTSFRAGQYSGCASLANTSIEVIPDGITSIGSSFRGYQYYGCTTLTTTAAEFLPDGVTSIESSFRDGQYSHCKSLISTATEVIPDRVTSIGLYFRAYQYYNCISLRGTATEVIPDSVTYIGSYVRACQYYGCTALLIGNHIHDYRFQQLSLYETPYQKMFYLDTAKTDPDTVPSYYTDSSQRQIAPITDVQPPNKKQYLTNRTGVEGYEEINENWK